MTEPTEATPNAQAESQESTTQGERAKGIESIEAKLAALSRGSEAEESATEPEEEGAAEETVAAEDEAEKPYTLAEIAASVAADPKWFDRLDKQGWSRVPPEAATIFKSLQGDFTRTVQKIKESTKPVETRQDAPKPRSVKEKAKEIFDDEAIDVIDAMLAEKIDSVIPPEKRERAAREEALNEGFDLAFSEVPQLKDDAVYGETMAVIDSNPRLVAMCQSGDKDLIALAFVTAADVAKERIARKTLEQQTTKVAKLDKAKADQQKEKLRVNAQNGKPPLSATAGAKGSGSDVSRYDKLVERYNTALAKQR